MWCHRSHRLYYPNQATMAIAIGCTVTARKVKLAKNPMERRRGWKFQLGGKSHKKFSRENNSQSEPLPIQQLTALKAWTLLVFTQNNFYLKNLLLGNEQWRAVDSIKHCEKLLLWSNIVFEKVVITQSNIKAIGPFRSTVFSKAHTSCITTSI